MIEDYFGRIEALITGAGIVRFFTITYDKRSAYIGFIRGSIYFLDGSLLHLREFVDMEHGSERYMYAYHRRFPQGENDQHFWVFQKSSWVLEDHREIPQPGNRLARLVESGFPQDWVVAALVEVHDDPFWLDFDHTPCCHKFAI